ncbi:hypothetical protein BDY21DRAFT_378860 [Lineolata rhizophorae]|uniref:Uncharacterized protein n=1 Tax=Lineolata rhizophorae TaxID=578093 RepID=A0A6A6P166_9PEZI|nr:hypothetical protein BDY21DRAFT_378860 [Lineolata rhizophorae]
MQYVPVPTPWDPPPLRLPPRRHHTIQPHYAVVWPRDGRNTSTWGRLKDVLTNHGPDMYVSITPTATAVDAPRREQWSGWVDVPVRRGVFGRQGSRAGGVRQESPVGGGSERRRRHNHATRYDSGLTGTFMSGGVAGPAPAPPTPAPTPGPGTAPSPMPAAHAQPRPHSRLTTAVDSDSGLSTDEAAVDDDEDAFSDGEWPPMPWAHRHSAERYDFRTRKYTTEPAFDSNAWRDVRWQPEPNGIFAQPRAYRTVGGQWWEVMELPGWAEAQRRRNGQGRRRRAPW